MNALSLANEKRGRRVLGRISSLINFTVYGSLFTNPVGMSGSVTVNKNRSRYHREENISIGSNLYVGKGNFE